MGAMSDDAPQPTVTMADVLALPDRQCRLVTWLMRRGESDLGAIAAFLDEDDAAARGIIADLAGRGFVVESGTGAGTAVAARVIEQRKRRVPSTVWDALDCSAGRRDEA
jgi:hypothetical protein